jgi:tubulin polyglutamylase TTLL6/13
VTYCCSYAINKKSKDFQQATTGPGDSRASKRSVASVLKQLDETGRCSSADVWRQICDLVVKTLLCIEPKLQSSYKSYFGSNDAAEAQWGPKCFEILGFDVMLDTAGKAWLFEVNHAPSFAGDSPLDRDIKTALISSTLDIVGVTNEKKRQYVRQQRADWAKRLWVATQAVPIKSSSGEQGNNQVTSKTTTSSLPHLRPDERKRAGGPEGTGESEGGLEDTSESGSESHSGESDSDNVTAEEGAKLERMSLKNVLLRRNRVNPVAAGEQETSHFLNEFSLLYPDEVSLHPNAMDPPSGYVYEKVREAAQVNKSKLWV